MPIANKSKFRGKKNRRHLLKAPKKVLEDPDDESSVSDADSMVDDDYGERAFLLDAAMSESNAKRPRKRRREPMEEEEEEKDEPRKMQQKEENLSQQLQFLLPVKSKEGVQMRYRQIEDTVSSSSKIIPKKDAKKSTKEEKVEIKSFATDPKWKHRIASLSFDVLENPEKNLKGVRELLDGLTEVDMDSVKIVALLASLTEVFKDILPGYRIHLASEIELDQQMKKDTMQLREYEEALLGLYQKFLQQLEKSTALLYGNKNISSEELAIAGHSVRCLSELLVTRIDFNFRKNIIDAIIFVSTCRFLPLIELAANTIQRVFKQDRQGDATADVMSSITKIAKTKGHRLSPLLLDTFLDVRVSKELLQNLVEDKKKEEKIDRKLLSYKERKHKKEVAKVEKDLQSNQLMENKKLKGRLHSQIIQSMFTIYFRILRREDDKVRARLLPSVLKGVAKYVHFIGVEFMDDLVRTMNNIVEDNESKSFEKLLCIRTVFSILAGDGSSLNIDPFKFYQHLFKVMQSMNGEDNRGENRGELVELFHCVQKGFIERRKLISADRAAQCAKHLANLALQSSCKESIALVLLLKTIFVAHPSLDRYLDAEFVAGSVIPGMSGSDITGPLWQLHQLRKHHHPANRALVDALLGNPKSLTSTFSNLMHCDPVEYLTETQTKDIFDT